MSEIWKAVPGFGGHYEASNLGRIRVKDRVVRKLSNFAGREVAQHYRGRVLKPSIRSAEGHLVVHLGYDRIKKNVSVHTMVLLAFVGPRPEGMEACHGNGDAADNRPENLRWDTHYENNQDRKRHGRYATGEAHPMARLTQQDANTIRALIADGYPRKEITRRFGISISTYDDIKNGARWNGN